MNILIFIKYFLTGDFTQPSDELKTIKSIYIILLQCLRIDSL